MSVDTSKEGASAPTSGAGAGAGSGAGAGAAVLTSTVEVTSPVDPVSGGPFDKLFRLELSRVRQRLKVGLCMCTCERVCVRVWCVACVCAAQVGAAVMGRAALACAPPVAQLCALLPRRVGCPHPH